MPLYSFLRLSKAGKKRLRDMPVFIPSKQVTDKQKRFPTNDLLILLLSIVVQLILGLLFGHIYDMRIFMATGYLVGTGQNPYIPQNLSSIFHNLSFQGITSVGYPPPWSLVLGFLYRIS
jgi:asparagine N-glycosylation enzyme membrane subunit Stt3